MTQSDIRARNEVLFRNLNERLTEIGDRLDTAAVGAPTIEREEFFCECGGLECMARIEMSREQYESVRYHATRFFTLESHADPEIERIVDRHPGFVVVEKFPGHQGAALEADPRPNDSG